MMVHIILLEPEHPGNIGSVARIMANFGVTKLVIINPKCKHFDMEAIKFAKHGLSILKKSRIVTTKYPEKELKKFHTIIATTSKLGTDYNIPRSPITPDQLTEILPKTKNIALLFGRESKGLSNSELDLADFVVTIPTSKKYPALNIAQSVAILLYEISKTKAHVSAHIVFSTKTEKNQIQKMFGQIFNKLPWLRPSKRTTQELIWKRIIGKSFLTKREAYAVMGFLRKLKDQLK